MTSYVPAALLGLESAHSHCRFGLASLYNHMTQFLIVNFLQDTLTHTNTHSHTHTLLVLFLWRALANTMKYYTAGKHTYKNMKEFFKCWGKKNSQKKMYGVVQLYKT